MKDRYKHRPIGEICEIVCGQDYKSVQEEKGKYPIYGTGGIMGYASQYRCPAKSVIIGRKGNINNPIYVEEPFWNVDTAFGVVPNKEYTCPKYFYYFCKNYDFSKHDVSVTIPSLRRTDIIKILVPVPPLPEQERIIAELDLLQSVIDKQKEQLKEFDTLAQSIFYDMFGDPVANEKGWKIKRLGEVCNFISGFAFKSELFRDNGLSVLRISNIKNNAVVEDDMVFFHTSDYKEDFSKYEVDNGDIVIAMSGATTGKLGVHRGSKTYYLNQRVGKFDIKDVSVLNKSYLFFFLQRMSEQILYDAMGVAQPNISSKQIRDYYIPLADIKLQQSFAKKIEAIEKQKENINQSIAETQKLFDYTMDKYFG